MPSKWRVTSNVIEGRRMYAVYCLIDPTEPDHSGNREIATDYIEDKERAKEHAKRLNMGGRWTGSAL